MRNSAKIKEDDNLPLERERDFSFFVPVLKKIQATFLAMPF